MEFPCLDQKSYEAVRNTGPESSKCTRPKIVKNLVALCAGTVMLFTAYDALTMLQSTMNHRDGVGVLSQATLYGFFCVSAILLPKFCISKFGSKNTSIAAMFAYLPYIASSYYPHWSLMIPSSVLLGIAGPLLWSSYGVYLNDISLLYSSQVEPTGTNDIKSAKKKSYDGITDKKCLLSQSLQNNVELMCGKSQGAPPLQSTKRQDYLVSHPVKHNDVLRYSKSQGPPPLPSAKRQDYLVPQTMKDNVQLMYGKSQDAEPLPSTKRQYSREISNTPMMRSYSSNATSKSSNQPQNEANIRSDYRYSSTFPYQGSNKESETKSLVAKAGSSLLSSTTAKFFGFHGMAHLTSHVWSSLLSYFILKTDIFVVDSSNSSCRCGVEFCSIDSECFESNAGNPRASVRIILTSICVCMCVVSILIVGLFLDALDQEKRQICFSLDCLKATCTILKRNEMLLLIPLSIHTGLVQGFYVGDFNKSYVACAWGTYHVGLVAVCYGVACGVSSLLAGWWVRRCGRSTVFTAAAVVNVASIVFLLWWTPDSRFPNMFFLASGLWGIHVGIVWSQLRALYGVLFKSDDEAAFSAFHLWSGFGFCIAFGFSNFFCIFHKLWGILAVSVLGFSGYYTVELIYCKHIKDSY